MEEQMRILLSNIVMYCYIILSVLAAFLAAKPKFKLDNKLDYYGAEKRLKTSLNLILWTILLPGIFATLVFSGCYIYLIAPELFLTYEIWEGGNHILVPALLFLNFVIQFILLRTTREEYALDAPYLDDLERVRKQSIKSSKMQILAGVLGLIACAI